MTINELKDEARKLILNGRNLTSSGRLETICRSQLNRPSFTLVLGDRCIYLEKDDRKIFIESLSSDKKHDGYGRIAYITAFNEAEKILEALKVKYEEAICVN